MSSAHLGLVLPRCHDGARSGRTLRPAASRVGAIAKNAAPGPERDEPRQEAEGGALSRGLCPEARRLFPNPFSSLSFQECVTRGARACGLGGHLPVYQVPHYVCVAVPASGGWVPRSWRKQTPKRSQPPRAPGSGGRAPGDPASPHTLASTLEG